MGRLYAEGGWGARGAPGAEGAVGAEGFSTAAAPAVGAASIAAPQNGHFLGSTPSAGNTVLPHGQSYGSVIAFALAGLKHI